MTIIQTGMRMKFRWQRREKLGSSFSFKWREKGNCHSALHMSRLFSEEKTWREIFTSNISHIEDSQDEMRIGGGNVFMKIEDSAGDDFFSSPVDRWEWLISSLFIHKHLLHSSVFIHSLVTDGVVMTAHKKVYSLNLFHVENHYAPVEMLILTCHWEKCDSSQKFLQHFDNMSRI